MKLDIDRVIVAASEIPRPFVRAPQYRGEGLSRLLGIELILKIETANPAGTVAGRSAEWWFDCNPDARRVVCASVGDFGVAMSHAGRARGVDVEVFGAVDADGAKVEGLRRAGTTVRLYARDADGVRAEAARYAIFVPIGRGSLALGTGALCKERLPLTRVVGVGSENAPGPVRSVRSRRLVPSPVVGTTKPEMGVPTPAEARAVALADALDDTALVTDPHLEQAAAALLAQEGIRASFDGAAGLAAAPRWLHRR